MNTGLIGEKLALEFLKNKGFELITKNYASRYGEIDIIMCNDNYIIFVEVKSRKNTRYGTPAQAVTYKKQKKIIITASEWITLNKINLQPRFDVVEVYMDSYKKTKIVHIENAFDAFDV